MKKFTRENKKVFYLFIFLIGIALIDAFFLSSRGYGIARYFLLPIVGMALVLDVDKTIYLIAFCLPISSMLKLSESSITVLPIIYLIVILKLISRKKVVINVYGFVCLCFFALLQLFSIIGYGANVVKIVSFFLNVLFVMCAASYFAKEKTDITLIKNTSIFYIAGVVAEIVLCQFFPKLPYIISYGKQIALDYNNRYAAMNADPNEYAQIVLVAIGLLVAIFPLLKSRLGKVVSFCTIAFLCIKGYESYSKSYVISLGLVFVIVLILYLVDIKKKRGLIAAIARLIPIVVIAVVGFIAIYDNVILPVLEARSSFNSDLLSGRDRIWKEVFSAILKRVDIILIGCGAGNVTFLNRYSSLTTEVPHNILFEFLIEFGVLGVICWGMIWRDTLREILANKITTYMFLPLLTFLITSMGISVNSNDCLYIVMLIMSMPYYSLNDKRKNPMRYRKV